MMSQTVTGTSASTTPVWVVAPLVPVVSQSLEVFPTRPTLTEQTLTGASALTAPFCAVDAEDWTAESERGGCLVQQADGVVLRGDRGVGIRRDHRAGSVRRTS